MARQPLTKCRTHCPGAFRTFQITQRQRLNHEPEMSSPMGGGEMALADTWQRHHLDRNF